MRITNLEILNNNFTKNNDIENLQRLTIGQKNKLASVDKEKKFREADAVAKEFETLFVDMMIKSMREAIKPDEETNAENIYKNMLDSEYSKNMTDAQSFGIREMVRQWVSENS